MTRRFIQIAICSIIMLGFTLSIPERSIAQDLQEYLRYRQRMQWYQQHMQDQQNQMLYEQWYRRSQLCRTEQSWSP
jgi:hypothetical protein